MKLESFADVLFCRYLFISFLFSGATKLKQTLWWQTIWMKIMIGVAIVVVIFIIVWIACGIDFSKCGAGK